MAGEMSLKIRLVDRDVLDADDVVAVDLRHAIHHQKRITMRQDLHHLRRVQRAVV